MRGKDTNGKGKGLIYMIPLNLIRIICPLIIERNMKRGVKLITIPLPSSVSLHYP